MSDTMIIDGQSVTFRYKCYVVECAQCELLFASNRKDKLTCSGACRVKAHRHGTIKKLVEFCSKFPMGEISPGEILQANAVSKLRPDLAKRIAHGEATFKDVRGEVWRSYWNLVEEQARA